MGVRGTPGAELSRRGVAGAVVGGGGNLGMELSPARAGCVADCGEALVANGLLGWRGVGPSARGADAAGAGMAGAGAEKPDAEQTRVGLGRGDAGFKIPIGLVNPVGAMVREAKSRQVCNGSIRPAAAIVFPPAAERCVMIRHFLWSDRLLKRKKGRRRTPRVKNLPRLSPRRVTGARTCGPLLRHSRAGRLQRGTNRDRASPSFVSILADAGRRGGASCGCMT